MLFNSYTFLFGFLPVALVGYHLLRVGERRQAAKLFLVGASLVFYGWWNWRYVPLVLTSIAINYAMSLGIAQAKRSARMITIAALAFNLGLLGYYKYANFFVDTARHLTGTDFQVAHVVLPLAISFFTFQQISYVVEVYKDRRAADSFIDYCLFVLFFPHLIAGPITHHKEMLPQFAKAGSGPVAPVFVRTGLVLLVVGLGKKVLVADTLASIANPVFSAAHAGAPLSFQTGWLGALAYTFQLYFDFSGYSDMAIGLALLFGIRMPVNFASPYKATSIVDFWRRWHITLSRFLQRYLYIPLGGNRHGRARRYLNLMLTMALGGLWHGAGWTFLAWGLLHGAYLCVNHLWNHLIGERGGRAGALAGWAVTFVAVVCAWVLFRADSFASALHILQAMASTPVAPASPGVPATAADWAGVAIGAVLAFGFPNSMELAGYPRAIPDAEFEAREAPVRTLSWPLPWPATAALLGAMAAVVIAKLPDPGIFLYFNF